LHLRKINGRTINLSLSKNVLLCALVRGLGLGFVLLEGGGFIKEGYQTLVVRVEGLWHQKLQEHKQFRERVIDRGAGEQDSAGARHLQQFAILARPRILD
jgi:hypothetical protein